MLRRVLFGFSLVDFAEHFAECGFRCAAGFGVLLFGSVVTLFAHSFVRARGFGDRSGGLGCFFGVNVSRGVQPGAHFFEFARYALKFRFALRLKTRKLGEQFAVAAVVFLFGDCFLFGGNVRAFFAVVCVFRRFLRRRLFRFGRLFARFCAYDVPFGFVDDVFPVRRGVIRVLGLCVQSAEYLVE